MNEEILSSERLYEGRVIKLDRLDVRLSNGLMAMRELVQHPGAVAVVPLDAEGNVLMVRQYRIAARRVMLEVPAGTLGVNEDPGDCAVRELQEETGYRAERFESLGGIFVAPGYTTEFIHLFLATDLVESRLPGDEDEFIEVDRVPLAEAIAMIDRGEIIDGKSIVSLLKVARRRGI